MLISCQRPPHVVWAVTSDSFLIGLESMELPKEQQEEEEEEEIRPEDAPTEFTVGNYFFYDSVESVLGMGSFGCVFRGQDLELNREVAVKRLPPDSIKVEELGIIKTLDSEYIVKVFDMVKTAEFSYVVMECCDCTLADHFIKVTEDWSLEHMSIANIDSVLESMASGYKELYLKQIIHRDLKPQNVLLRYAGPMTDSSKETPIVAAKISDFGTSRLGRRSYTKLVGTPLYMAPEIGANVLSEMEYDFRVDMWSLGVLTYELLTTKVPFDEAGLCRLFLFACNNNFLGYRCPPLPQDCLPRHKMLVVRLLDMDARRRLTPLEFYECVQERRVPHGICSTPNLQNGIKLLDSENYKKQRCF